MLIRQSAAVSPVGAVCVVARCGVKRPTRPLSVYHFIKRGPAIQGKNKLFWKRRSCYQDLPKIPAQPAAFPAQ
jgi:hypothetical protein